MRYVCAKYKGKNGESLYPGAADPMLSYAIDEVVDFAEEAVAQNRFFYLKKMGTPEYDEAFKHFILKDMPAFLTKLEGRLKSSKYILSD